MIRISVFSMFVLAVFAAFAAPLGFRVVNDHAACLYRLGEEATFTVTATSPDGTKAKAGVVNVSLNNFGTKNQLWRKVDLAKENPFVLKGKLDEPGFLRMTASVNGQPNFCWSVGYEPTKLEKGSPSPDDFDEFWANARRKLAEEVPLDAQVVRIPERCKPAYDFYRVSFATFGRRVYGYMSVPTDKRKAPYPVEVEVAAAGFGFWTNGMGGDANSIRLFFSVYPFEPHWNWEKLNLRSKYDKLNAGCRAKYGTGYETAGLAASREEYFFYPVILGIDRAMDWVAARPDVDRSRFWYHGTSQGGGFGFYLAGLNRNFTRAALFVPALTDTMGYRKGRQSGWPFAIESQKHENRAAAEKWAPYFDAANFAKRIRCPVRVAVGFADVTCAPCAVYSAYNAIPVADKGIVNGIGMGHGCHEKYYKELRKWLRAPASAPSATERLRTRLLEIGRSDKFIYAWSTSWWGWNDYWYGKFRQHAGVMPSMYFCEFRDICGTWNSREYYEKYRAKLKEIVKRDYRERGAIPLVTWHLENPYVPPRWGADKDGQGFRYRYVDPGYPQEHRNVLREIAQRTGSPCGSGRVDGVPGKIFPNPREWYEWILKDMLAFWRTVRDDEGHPIPIIIRPFHEMDGDWFWWGPGSSTPQDYIAVYRLTVDMIRKELGSENVLFCYGPDRLWNGIAGEEGKSGYLKWYPGDEYVDMLAIDDYSIGKGDTVKSTEKAIERLRVISEIGRKRGKFCGIAECGAKDSSDDFYSIIHRVMTAPGVDFAIAATYDGPWTFPESEAGKADMRRFFQRPEVLSGDVLKQKDSAADFGVPRAARTIRPEGVGFTFNPGLRTFLPLNDDYSVMLNGRKAEVRACRESRFPFNRYWPGRQRSLDQTERASYLAFEAEGAVACSVKTKWSCEKAVIRPLSAGIKPVVTNGVISFTLPRAGYYVLETAGQHKALHIFMEPPRRFPERTEATMSFGPGMHIAGLVRLKSGDRVYIDRDAIVFGCFLGENVEDVKVFGHGVIDGRVCERIFEGGYSPLQMSCLRFHGSRGISIDGPILMDAPCWALACFGCEDVDIRHVKIVGQWRYNTDGIDICNSRRVAVRDCFVRSFDDAIVIKGVPPLRHLPVEDIIVERCVAWCAWGKTLEPGIETWAPHFRNIRFSDCDLIRNAHSAVNVSAGGTAVMENFVFEDIRVELQKDNLPPVIQQSDDHKYDGKGKKHFPLLLRVDNMHYGKDKDEPWGCVKNCTFRDIAVYAEPGIPKPGIEVSAHKKSEKDDNPFENIVFERFSINGKAVDWSEFSFRTNVSVRLGGQPRNARN